MQSTGSASGETQPTDHTKALWKQISPLIKLPRPTINSEATQVEELVTPHHTDKTPWSSQAGDRLHEGAEEGTRWTLRRKSNAGTAPGCQLSAPRKSLGLTWKH